MPAKKRHPGRPKKEKTELCRAEGCEKIANGARGFCHTHYIYSRRGIIDPKTGKRLRAPKRIARYSPDAECIVLGCSGFPKSKGMCNKHMLQRQAGIIDENGEQLRPIFPTGRKRERERWIGSTRDGYILVVAPPRHPRMRADGTILEHRLIMEQRVGRYLEEWEIVHHKDGDRANNCIENLQLLDGRARKKLGKLNRGHPPGSEFDARTAVQILLQREDLPESLRRDLTRYRKNV